MACQHLTRTVWDTVFGGLRDPGTLLPAVLAHLFDLCSICEAEFTAWRQSLHRTPAANFDELFERARAQLVEVEARVHEEKTLAEPLLAELFALPASQRLEAVREAPGRFRGAVLAELVIEASHERVGGRPREALALAQIAKAVLQHSELTGAVVDLYARAMAHTANALRVCGMLAEASEMFDDARFLLESSGSGDRQLFAEIDRLEGLLRKAQRCFPEATLLLNRAIIAYRMLGDAREAAGALLYLGLLYRETGDHAHALASTREVLELIDSEEDPRLLLYARHNLALILCDVGAVREAEVLLEENRPLFDRLGDSIAHLRRAWLEGLVAAGFGRSEEAEHCFLAAHHGFVRHGLSYDAALVALDLAAVYLKAGRADDVKRLAGQAVEVFRAEHIHRETLAAMMLFQEAAELEQVSSGLVRELARFVIQAREDPSLSFRPVS